MIQERDVRKRLNDIKESHHVDGFHGYQPLDKESLKKLDAIRLHSTAKENQVWVHDMDYSNKKPVIQFASSCFSEGEFSQLTVSKEAVFINCLFDDQKFKDVKMNHSLFIDCHFEHVQMDHSHFRGSWFIGCSFEEVTMTRIHLEDAIFVNCDIRGIQASYEKNDPDKCFRNEGTRMFEIDCPSCVTGGDHELLTSQGDGKEEQMIQEREEEKEMIEERENVLREVSAEEEIIRSELYTGQTFTQVSEGFDFRGKVFEGCTFEGVTFGVITPETSFGNCIFNGCTFSDIFIGSRIGGCQFNSCLFQKPVFNTFFDGGKMTFRQGQEKVFRNCIMNIDCEAGIMNYCLDNCYSEEMMKDMMSREEHDRMLKAKEKECEELMSRTAAEHQEAADPSELLEGLVQGFGKAYEALSNLCESFSPEPVVREVRAELTDDEKKGIAIAYYHSLSVQDRFFFSSGTDRFAYDPETVDAGQVNQPSELPGSHAVSDESYEGAPEMQEDEAVFGDEPEKENGAEI